MSCPKLFWTLPSIINDHEIYTGALLRPLNILILTSNSPRQFVDDIFTKIIYNTFFINSNSNFYCSLLLRVQLKVSHIGFGNGLPTLFEATIIYYIYMYVQQGPKIEYHINKNARMSECQVRY